MSWARSPDKPELLGGYLLSAGCRVLGFRGVSWFDGGFWILRFRVEGLGKFRVQGFIVSVNSSRPLGGLGIPHSGKTGVSAHDQPYGDQLPYPHIWNPGICNMKLRISTASSVYGFLRI